MNLYIESNVSYSDFVFSYYYQLLSTVIDIYKYIYIYIYTYHKLAIKVVYLLSSQFVHQNIIVYTIKSNDTMSYI